MKNYSVGMKVFLQPIVGRAPACSIRLIPGVITKVGRKYLFVSTNNGQEKFELEGNNQHIDDVYGPQFRLWLSKEDFIAYREVMEMSRVIRTVFQPPTENQELVRKVYAVLEEYGVAEPIEVNPIVIEEEST